MAQAATEAKKAVESLWKLGGLSPVQLFKRVGREFSDDDIPGRSAELAYFFFLAIFPALLVIITVLGFMAGPGSSIRNEIMNYLGRVMPGDAHSLVNRTLTQASVGAGGWKVAIGLIVALWSASAGVSAMGDVLNICYEVKETRPFWRKKLVHIGLTIALSVLVIVAATLVLYGGNIAELIGRQVELGNEFVLTWKILQWPVALFCLSVAFAAVYYFAPNLEKPAWYWITPGSVAGLLLWLAASAALRVYLHFFNSYNATYGALGAVIILMLWFYLSAMAMLLGGEINAEIGHAAKARDMHRESLRVLEVRPEERAA